MQYSRLRLTYNRWVTGDPKERERDWLHPFRFIGFLTIRCGNLHNENIKTLFDLFDEYPFISFLLFGKGVKGKKQEWKWNNIAFLDLPTHEIKIYITFWHNATLSEIENGVSHIVQWRRMEAVNLHLTFTLFEPQIYSFH